MIPDTIFPSDNPQGIPVLNPDLQCDLVDMPLKAWGSVRRTSTMTGTWHFYVYDYRFSALWKDPQVLVNTNCVSVVETNFSIRDQTPYSVGLYRIYQKRWLSRYWQSKGIRIIADLNVSRPFLELNMLGIPKGWTSYATHGYNDQLDLLEIQYQMAVKRAGTKNIFFLVYGGGEKVKRYCKKHPVILHIFEHREVYAAA
jgi:hypothetical protein